MADEALLIERCRQGDPLAWEALVRRYQGRVYAAAYHFLRDSEEARDLAQESFIRVYQQLGKFSGGAFLPWVLRLTRNLCIDRTRRIKARPPATDVPADEATNLSDGAPGPEAAWLTDRHKKVVHSAMGQLSETNREMILLKEIQGLSLPEISTMLGIPIGTAKSRSNRARIELARKVLAIDPSYGAT